MVLLGRNGQQYNPDISHDDDDGSAKQQKEEQRRYLVNMCVCLGSRGACVRAFVCAYVCVCGGGGRVCVCVCVCVCVEAGGGV